MAKNEKKAPHRRADMVAVNYAFRAMVEMLNSPKKIDELKRCPAYVKDGMIYDFRDREHGATDSEDCEIFKLDRVMKAQAVTVALKRDYTKALYTWLGEDTDTEDEKVADANEPVKTKEETTENTGAEKAEFDDKAFKKLLSKGKIKKAKRLLAEAKDLLGKKEYKVLKKELASVEEGEA